VPLYEFECGRCHHRFERLQQRFSDPMPSKCPECGGPVSQLVSAPSIQFKGSGWYVTDYAKKSSSPAPPSSSANGKSEKDSPDTKKTATETNTDTKTETKKEKPDKK